jgi:hypothetical protein
MLPCTLILIFARNAVKEYRKGRLGIPYGTDFIEETVAAVAPVQPGLPDEEGLEVEATTKVNK